MDDEYDPLPFENTVDVVVLEEREGRIVPVAGCTPVDLERGVEPVGALLTELLAATVRVRADEGTPPDVLAELWDIPVPAAFRASPWLNVSRAVVVRDGIGRAGELYVRYRDTSGLRIELPETGSTTDPNADFDSDYDPDGNG